MAFDPRLSFGGTFGVFGGFPGGGDSFQFRLAAGASRNAATPAPKRFARR